MSDTSDRLAVALKNTLIPQALELLERVVVAYEQKNSLPAMVVNIQVTDLEDVEDAIGEAVRVYTNRRNRLG